MSMMLAVDGHPLPARFRDSVWRGLLVWRGLRHLFSAVDSIGVPQSTGDVCLIPVRYTSGAHAVLRVRCELRRNGIERYTHEEVLPYRRDLRDAIASSVGMPDIISVDPNSYVIGLNDEYGDLVLRMRSHSWSIVHESLDRLPR
jgi:hypothetical protein